MTPLAVQEYVGTAKRLCRFLGDPGLESFHVFLAIFLGSREWLLRKVLGIDQLSFSMDMETQLEEFRGLPPAGPDGWEEVEWASAEAQTATNASLRKFSKRNSDEPQALALLLAVVENADERLESLVSENDLGEALEGLQSGKGSIAETDSKTKRPVAPSAAWEKLSPPEGGSLVAREAETRRILYEFGRLDPKCVILTGDSGVGKTSVAYRFAEELEGGEIPQELVGTDILNVRIADLPSNPDERIRKLSRAFEEAVNTNSIVFIDEIHSLFVSSWKDGSERVAEFFRESLGRTGLRILGTTTHSEYKRIFSEEEALVRRCAEVKVSTLPRPAMEEAVGNLISEMESRTGIALREEDREGVANFCLDSLPANKMPGDARSLFDTAWVMVRIAGRDVATFSDVRAAFTEVYGFTGGALEALDDGFFDRIEGSMVDRIVGQSEAVSFVMKMLLRAFGQYSTRPRPRLSLLMMGPSGVGKTELAKVMAKALFGDPKRFHSLHMGEYGYREAATKLIGFQKGIRDSEHGGILTEMVRRNPDCVILLDEIDKADSSVFDLLYKILDEGYVTDGRGQEADFSRAYILLSTNSGIKQLTQKGKKATIGFIQEESEKESSNERSVLCRALQDEGAGEFSEAFLGRLDGVVLFNELGLPELVSIARVLIEEAFGEPARRQDGLEVEIDDSACEALALACGVSDFGARTLRQLCDEMVIVPLAERRAKEFRSWQALKQVQIRSDIQDLLESPDHVQPTRVLFADDRPGEVEELMAAIADLGEVECVSDPGAVKDAIVRKATDLLFLDLSWENGSDGSPNLHGLEILQTVRKANERLPIVVLSSLTDSEIARYTWRYAVTDFLAKQDARKDPTRFADRVDRWIRNERLVRLVEGGSAGKGYRLDCQLSSPSPETLVLDILVTPSTS